MKPIKIHLDASTPGHALRRAYCGYLNVPTEVEMALVTCGLCVKRLRQSTSEKKRPKAIGEVEFRGELVSAFAQATAYPTADAPPRLSPAEWSQVCSSTDGEPLAVPMYGTQDDDDAYDARCKQCDVCKHEDSMVRWEYAAPSRHDVTRSEPDRALPRWRTLNAALVDLANYEAHDRAAPSATGFMLARAERGDLNTDSGQSRPDDPQMRRADDIVHVRQALEAAYDDGAHRLLTAAQCMAVLMSRTPGATAPKSPKEPAEMPTYEALADRLSVSVGELKAVVRHGRLRVTEELTKRGMLPDR
jgi:hypothetical protein